MSFIPRESAEQLRYAMQIEVHGGIEQTREHPRHLARHAIARHAERDQGVVVRPYAADVVTHWVVARLARANRADSPPGKQLVMEQSPPHFHGAIGRSDSGEETLARVRSAHPARLLVAVQRQSVGRQFLAPERVFEAISQPVGAGGIQRRLVRPRERRCQRRARPPRRVRVALNLRHRDRPLGQRAIRVKDGVVGIFPALVQ